MSAILKLPLKDFLDRCKAQGAGSREHIVFKCPICQTLQSGADLIKAGAGATFDEVEKYLGFSCVGRFTRAGPFHAKKSTPGKGCDWTLGGLFSLHELVVVSADGKEHMHFMPATAEEARAHWDATRPLVSVELATVKEALQTA